MTQPASGQPETNNEINLADDPDLRQSIPSPHRRRVWVHRRHHRPTRAWVRLVWRRIEFRIGFITTGHPVHDAVSFNLLVAGSVMAAMSTAGLCNAVHASNWITVPAPLVVGAVTLKVGLAYLDRRDRRKRRPRRR
jgi:hypothetical protein